MRRVLVCTAIGERYRSAFRSERQQFEAYAALCGAETALIESPLDPKGRRSFFPQRLLIPRAFSSYDIVLHLDIDVLIPRNLPDLFALVPENAGFAAVIDPRGSYAYQKAWGFADWASRGHGSYFAGVGLTSRNELASINGGVQVYRPRLVAALFESWYFDDRKYKPPFAADFSATEEGPSAYLSQANGLFAPLEYRFNRQVLFALHETSLGKAAFEKYCSIPNRTWRKIRTTLGLPSHQIGFGAAYRRFVEDLLRNGNLVHFAGKYPIPVVDPALLTG
jgi:hypothetical protein